MSHNDIVYAVDSAVATIRFNRPDTRNAFGDTTRDQLLDLLEQASSDKQVRCIVITGTGRAFAAGGDVRSMQVQQENNDPSIVASRIVVANKVVRLLRDVAKPVIAAINGAAAGGGMNLALACDIRYASSSAFFSESFVKIGVVPDWGGHYFLTRLVGASQAMELMMLGERIDANTALRLGIVNAIYADDIFEQEVMKKARAFAAAPQGVIETVKRGVNAATNGTLDDTLEFELNAQREIFLSDDAREGINAFIDKRAPQFRSK